MPEHSEERSREVVRPVPNDTTTARTNRLEKLDLRSRKPLPSLSPRCQRLRRSLQQPHLRRHKFSYLKETISVRD